MNLSLIKCLFLGHKIKKITSSPPAVSIPAANSIPGFTMGIGLAPPDPFWMITYLNCGREWILHPCSRCNVMVAVEKRGKK